MPYAIRKTGKGKYSVKSPHGTKAKSTTLAKAKAQIRAIHAKKAK